MRRELFCEITLNFDQVNGVHTSITVSIFILCCIICMYISLLFIIKNGSWKIYFYKSNLHMYANFLFEQCWCKYII